MLLLPFALLYLWHRGKKEPLYRQFWGERFGNVHCTLHQPIWIHSASLGELRGAAPWVQALLQERQQVFITTLTPAGRNAAQSLFAESITGGNLQLAYAPMESRFAVRRFIRNVRPKAAVMTEIDSWPVLLATISQANLPLAMANAQYPAASFARDKRWGNIRSHVYRLYDLIMCKSTTHAQRFEQIGCHNVHIVGETRFDLPIPEHHLSQAQILHQRFALVNRPVVCIASVIEAEEGIFNDALRVLAQQLQAHGLPRPLCVYVPRSPQRFEVLDEKLSQDWRVLCRSKALDEQLNWQLSDDLTHADILLGDSLGEMYFYLALSDVVVVADGFAGSGGHNVIEPLALRKPVWVGSNINGIEYPGVEAIAAGVLQQADDATQLANALTHYFTDPQAAKCHAQKAAQFYAEHAGSAQKHMAVFMPWLADKTHAS